MSASVRRGIARRIGPLVAPRIGLVLIALAGAAAGCAVHTARPVGTARAELVDRAVDAPPFRLTLGDFFLDSVRANRLADSLYQLRPDSAGSVATLTVHLTPDRRISVIDVAYGPVRRYADEVAHATGRLGNPSRRFTADDGSQYTIWQDARTRFEVVGRAYDNRSLVSARLTDLLLARP